MYVSEKFLIFLCSLFISFNMIFLCLEICIKKKHLSSLESFEDQRHTSHIVTSVLASTLGSISCWVKQKIDYCIWFGWILKTIMFNIERIINICHHNVLFYVKGVRNLETLTCKSLLSLAHVFEKSSCLFICFLTNHIVILLYKKELLVF